MCSCAACSSVLISRCVLPFFIFDFFCLGLLGATIWTSVLSRNSLKFFICFSLMGKLSFLMPHACRLLTSRPSFSLILLMTSHSLSWGFLWWCALWVCNIHSFPLPHNLCLSWYLSTSPLPIAWDLPPLWTCVPVLWLCGTWRLLGLLGLTTCRMTSWLGGSRHPSPHRDLKIQVRNFWNFSLFSSSHVIFDCGDVICSLGNFALYPCLKFIFVLERINNFLGILNCRL